MLYCIHMAKVRHKFTTGKKTKHASAPTPLPPDPEEEAARLLLDGIESVEPDESKILYEFSSARTMYDLSDATKKRAGKAASSIYLLIVASLLIAWVLTSLIYRLMTESNGGRVWLSMIPSLIFTAAATAIVVLSVRGLWGTVARFAIRHNLHSAHGVDRIRIEQMRRAFEVADRNARRENAITVTERQTTVKLYGRGVTVSRDKTTVRCVRENGALRLTFRIDGRTIAFPELVPLEDYYRLKKAFGKNLTTVRATATAVERDENGKRLYGGDTLASVVGGAVMSCVILGAGVMLVVTHYLWVPGIPPFLGVFFAMMSMLAFGNTFSHRPGVSYVMIPLAFSLVLLVVPPWIFIWYETELAQNALTLFGILTHADAFPVGMTFFSCLGGYVFVFAMTRLVEFVRFGKEE